MKAEKQIDFNFSSQHGDHHRAAEPLPAKNPGDMTLDLQGMHCASCAQRIESEILKDKGVTSASVNFALHKAHVVFDESKTSAAQILGAIKQLGYGAVPATALTYTPPSAADRAEFRLGLSIAIVIPFLLEMIWPFMFGHGFMPVWVQLALASASQFYLAQPFYKATLQTVRAGHFTMDSLVVMGTTAAYALSLLQIDWAASSFATFPPDLILKHGHTYFEAGAAIIAFVLIGQHLEKKVLRSANADILNLAAMVGSHATLWQNGQEISMPIEYIKTGDIVLVRPGEKIPVDGTIVRGETEINESLLSGEVAPNFKKPGDAVFAGSTNVTHLVEIRTGGTGDESRLGAITAMVANALSTKTENTKKVDRICAVFVPAVMGIAAITFMMWAAWDLQHGATLERALLNAIAVMVIACPCALGLATPAVVIAIINKAAKEGLLVKNIAAVEDAQKIDTVVLDKTGTLTMGQPKITAMKALEPFNEALLLRLAASATSKSLHPLAEAVQQFARQDGAKLIAPQEIEEIAGRGIAAKFSEIALLPRALNIPPSEHGLTVVFGNRRLLNSYNFDLTPLDGITEEWAQEGYSLSFAGLLAGPGKRMLAGIIAFEDPPRVEAKDIIAFIKERGISIQLLTGDHRKSAEKAGRQLGIETIEADIVPEEKAGRIKSLRARGRKVLMVGDGINDAAALAESNIGVSMQTGADIALEASDITLMRNNLMDLRKIFFLSDYMQQKIRENLTWAFGFNLVGIPLAGLGFLNPGFAGFAMATSSILVVLNALQILRRSQIG